MIQRCKNFGFPLEAIHVPGITSKHLGQYLERNLAFQFRVGGAIHFTHTTFAEFRRDAIMRDRLADHFFSSTSQFTTTVKGGAEAELRAIVSSRKRFPSAVTSYSKIVLKKPWARCASNSGRGASTSK